MAPHDPLLSPLYNKIKELKNLIEALEDRIYELEQINEDRIDEDKTQQFYEDKLGL